jgi:hypothetical protein
MIIHQLWQHMRDQFPAQEEEGNGGNATVGEAFALSALAS